MEFCIHVVESFVVSRMAPVISELKQHNTIMITNVYAPSLNLVLCEKNFLLMLFLFIVKREMLATGIS